jgi:inner membrane transporter RhtA
MADTIPTMPSGAVPGQVRSRRPPALALVATSAVSVQCGAAIATHLFGQVGPSGAVTLRLVLAAAAMLVVVRPRRRSVAALLGRGRDLVVAAVFGLVLAGMNLSFYEAISRVPLGVAVTVEFVGPLAVSVAASRRRSDLLWALLAGAGVVLLAGGGLLGAHRLDPVGTAMALIAGMLWAGYIIASKQTGRRFPGASGLAIAMVVAAVVVAPFGVAEAGGRLVRPTVLGLGLAVAILSSALPYSLELYALRRVTPRAFGVLLSIDPAIAALAGLAVLGQHLSWSELLALGLVVAANAGNAIVDGRSAAVGVGELPAGELPLPAGELPARRGSPTTSP